MAETQCSTMHCRNRAIVTNIPRDGKWWDQIANPAPFCATCMNDAESKKPVIK